MYLKILICFFLVISSFGCNKNGPQAADIVASTWQALGPRGFSPGIADKIKICMNGSVPYVAFLDGAYGRKLSVMNEQNRAYQLRPVRYHP